MRSADFTTVQLICSTVKQFKSQDTTPSDVMLQQQYDTEYQRCAVYHELKSQ